VYSIPNPIGEWSYISIDGKKSLRIDHAYIFSSLEYSSAKYITDVDSKDLKYLIR